MACITDARSHVPSVDKMEYDIVVQGPNGNGRISRSIVTKDVNPEEIFPTKFINNFADDNGVENVAAPAATPDNVKKGFRILEKIEFGNIPPPPSSNFRGLDRDAFKSQFEDWKQKVADKMSSVPSPSIQDIEVKSLPEITLPDIKSWKEVAPAPPPPEPTPVDFKQDVKQVFQDKVKEIFKPIEFKKTIDIYKS